MFSNYTEKTKEMQLLTELRSPFQRSEQHERSCKLRHIVIFTHNAIRRVANLLWWVIFTVTVQTIRHAIRPHVLDVVVSVIFSVIVPRNVNGTKQR